VECSFYTMMWNTVRNTQISMCVQNSLQFAMVFDRRHTGQISNWSNSKLVKLLFGGGGYRCCLFDRILGRPRSVFSETPRYLHHSALEAPVPGGCALYQSQHLPPLIPQPHVTARRSKQKLPDSFSAHTQEKSSL
jgi:hypothetical protein